MRSRLARRGVVALVALALVVLALVVCSPDRKTPDHLGVGSNVGVSSDVVAFNYVNSYRARLAQPSLTMDAGLNVDARRWVEHLADTGTLSHDALELNGWTVLGENVGRGATVEAIQRAFEASSTHALNLVGDYTHLGVAVAARGGVVWVVQRFGARVSVSVPVPVPAPVTISVPPVTRARATTTVTLAPPLLCQQVQR